MILSDEVYDRLYYVPFTRIARLSPEIERLTLVVGSAGKNFYATGWRVGTLGPFFPNPPPARAGGTGWEGARRGATASKGTRVGG